MSTEKVIVRGIICAGFSSLLLLCACATSGGSRCGEIKDNLESENILMKRNLVLIERENSVIREENLSYKRDLQTKTALAEKLEEDIKSLTDKYKKDISLWEQKYGNLMDKNKILEKESSEKIREMTALNKDLEIRLGNQIKKLNEDMQKKEQEHHGEKEKMKTDFAQREFNLQKDIEEMKRTLKGKDEEIATLKSQNIQMQGQIAEHGKTVAALNAQIGKLESALRDLKAKIEALEKEKGAAAPKEKPEEKKTVPDAKKAPEPDKKPDKPEGKK